MPREHHGGGWMPSEEAPLSIGLFQCVFLQWSGYSVFSRFDQSIRFVSCFTEFVLNYYSSASVFREFNGSRFDTSRLHAISW